MHILCRTAVLSFDNIGLLPNLPCPEIVDVDYHFDPTCDSITLMSSSSDREASKLVVSIIMLTNGRNASTTLVGLTAVNVDWNALQNPLSKTVSLVEMAVSYQ